ncbi:MAG: site-specific DNA-methyltransferase [Ktedonobacterales bacterium]|nr:site-specific DNA-methyltransferase [Ktedonobacterales bacterium]
MDGAKAFQCIWTDPPYGVAYQSNLSVEEAKRLHRRTDGKEVANDTLPEPMVQQMLTNALTLAAHYSTVGASAYVAAPAAPLHRRFIDAMNDSGFQYRAGLVWVKDVFVFGRSDYHYRHEPILYGWLQNGAHYFTDDRTLDSVFEVPRPRRSEDHPTMKPIALVAAMLANSSHDGDVVYEPFAGSGTTLIAAERLGRTCRAVEIDPRYCDVILRRYEAETGREATLLQRISEPEHATA